ncbi:MAG: helix-turn-helix domain-containing protein [Thermoleophilaceae bacterium]
MASIGDRLRDARTRRGLDFDDVEAATKIRARYLRALEAEQFDLLPGPTFARTFLRTYGEFLGLDARLLVEEYRTHHEPRDEVLEAPSRPVSAGGRERPVAAPVRLPGPLGLLAGGAVAVVLFLLVLGLVAGAPGPDAPSAPPTGTDAADRPRGERGRRRPRRRPAPTSVSLRVTPSEATYVCVEDGAGKVRFEGVMAAPRRFRAKRLRINLGKRSARLAVNGRRIRFDDGPASPVAFDLRPRRARRLPAGQGLCS